MNLEENKSVNGGFVVFFGETTAPSAGSILKQHQKHEMMVFQWQCLSSCKKLTVHINGFLMGRGKRAWIGKC